ncbi:hypothetical protein KM043_013520 [Ampulex compressa]|nr:hypothetical protein KM043_013520 [Ampulex compressa]
MFRLVDRPLSFRQRANGWIYKMLFLWSREPAPGPKAGPWFAWFATAVVLWRCRRRITKAILAVSPLRLLRRRTAVAPINPKSLTTGTPPRRQLLKQRRLVSYQKQKSTGIKTRVKRLCTGDGPHVSSSAPAIQTKQQIHYKVTRSGKIYGKYPNSIVMPASSICGRH